MEKKYQVFISSTYKDLIEERKRVRDAILSMYHFPVGMEMFGAADEEQWQIIKETIDSSDYYVLIIGQKYGTITSESDDEPGISYTEKEFRYALSKDIPVLSFVIDDNVPIKPDNMEIDNPERLKEFKNEVRDGRLVETWTNPDDLAQKVTSALYNQIRRTERPGWIRGDSVDLEKNLSIIADLNKRNKILSDKNKELDSELQAYKNKEHRMPKLELSIDGDLDLDERYASLLVRSRNIIVDNNNIIHLKVGSIDLSVVDDMFKELSKNDFSEETWKYVSDEEIINYNNALPDRNEIETFRKKYQQYHLLVDYGIASVVNIYNNGTAKATDVSVNIEFPPEIRVMRLSAVKKIPKPESPMIQKDLRQIAYERAHESYYKIQSKLEQLGYGNKVVPYDYSSMLGDIMIIGESLQIDNNVISIGTEKGIVHTRYSSFNGIYMVPLKKGNYKALVTLMCAEYKNPVQTELTFVCD